MRLTSQVIAFPLKEVLEKDTHGKLFRETMDHMTAVADFLDGPGRDVSRAGPLKASLAYSRVSLVLTTRLEAAGKAMVLARNWVNEEIADDDVITALGRLRLGDAERWWDDENTPDELLQLCLITEALLARVRSAADRLKRTVEESQKGAA